MMLLQTYDVQPPNEVDNSQCALSDKVDEIAVQVLNKFHPVINTTHVPISITGDGNCLFRAVSMALYGSDEYHTYIRLLTALEIIENQANYDYEHDAYVDPFNDQRLLFDTYNQLVKDVTKVGSFSCLLVVSAISAAMD